MTEKRFKMVIVDVQGNFYYLDRVTDEKISSTLALEDKLNELADENEQLKQENEKWKEKYFTMGEMFSKQVDNIDEVNNILVDADTMNKEQLIRKIDKVINND